MVSYTNLLFLQIVKHQICILQQPEVIPVVEISKKNWMGFNENLQHYTCIYMCQTSTDLHIFSTCAIKWHKVYSLSILFWFRKIPPSSQEKHCVRVSNDKWEGLGRTLILKSSAQKHEILSLLSLNPGVLIKVLPAPFPPPFYLFTWLEKKMSTW